MSGQGYGSEHYIYTPDQPFRQRTVFARTIRPTPTETNYMFEQRMDEMASMLVRQHGALQVDLDMLRQDGAIVECLVSVSYAPRSEPIALDDRPAGGRVSGTRGVRGGR